MSTEAEIICKEGMCTFAQKCHLGHASQSECPTHQILENPAPQPNPEREVEPEALEDLPVPWPGSAYSQATLQHLVVRQRPILVGVMGLVNAGKTSFLGSMYGLLLKGKSLEGVTWGGSDTLVGWEVVASSMRWRPDFYPGFPPHTPRGGRVPGLLHHRFCLGEEDWRELLFTDAAGEWFAHWAVNEEDLLAESARWVARHMDMVLFFIDSAALMESPASETLRIKQLLARLKANLGGRPMMVVWAKQDLLQENRHTTRLKEHIDSHFSGVPHQGTHALADVSEPGRGVMEVLQWVLQHSKPESPGKSIESRVTSDNPFFWFRGAHEQ